MCLLLVDTEHWNSISHEKYDGGYYHPNVIMVHICFSASVGIRTLPEVVMQWRPRFVGALAGGSVRWHVSLSDLGLRLLFATRVLVSSPD